MKQIFINLPVKDLGASMKFYRALGFTEYSLFTFEHQECMLWGDQIYLMLQSFEMFKSGNKKNLSDSKTNTIASFTLPVESVERVNELIENGLKAGGTESTAMIDEGFMQVRNIEDPDGHQWGIIYLNLERFKKITGKK
jgi:uncharacterized protein